MVPPQDRSDRAFRRGGPSREDADAGAAPIRETTRLRGRGHRHAHRDARGRRAAAARAVGDPPGLQDGGHVRGGVRGRDTVLLLDLRAGERGVAARRTESRDPRQRPDPHRTGHRVRLLLRPVGGRAPRARRRADHGEQQPGDSLDRLRRFGPALLRPSRRGVSRGGTRKRTWRGLRPLQHPCHPGVGSVRRTDRTQSGRADRGPGRRDRGHVGGRDRGRGGSPTFPRPRRRARHPAAARRHRRVARRGGRGGDRDRISRPRAALVRARRPRHGDRVRPRGPGALLHVRARGRHRPRPRGQVPTREGGRGRRGQRRPRHARRRDHGAHRARGRPLWRQLRGVPRAEPPPSGTLRDHRAHAADRGGDRGPWLVEHPVHRDQRRWGEFGGRSPSNSGMGPRGESEG